MPRFLTLALCLLVAGCGPPPGPAPPPAPPPAPAPEPGTSPFLLPDQSWEHGGFRLEIRREYEGDGQAELIRRAESEQPPRKAVLALIGDKASQKRVGVGEEPLWWFQTFDGIRIPYAITQEALLYYVQVMEAFREGDFVPSKGVAMKKAILEYSASVSHHDAFEHSGRILEKVDVVHMSLSWSQYCGGECAMAFHKERIVVFGKGGQVQAVFLDGETPYIVS
jgi:hypothetical protein